MRQSFQDTTGVEGTVGKGETALGIRVERVFGFLWAGPVEEGKRRSQEESEQESAKHSGRQETGARSVGSGSPGRSQGRPRKAANLRKWASGSRESVQRPLAALDRQGQGQGRSDGSNTGCIATCMAADGVHVHVRTVLQSTHKYVGRSTQKYHLPKAAGLGPGLDWQAPTVTCGTLPWRACWDNFVPVVSTWAGAPKIAFRKEGMGQRVLLKSVEKGRLSANQGTRPVSCENKENRKQGDEDTKVLVCRS